MQIKTSKTFQLVGRGDVKITTNDHIATGGEGSIYKVKGSMTIVKLYTDTQKMVRDGMPDKLNLLSKINSRFIVSPKGLVLSAGNPIGYYMSFVKGEALSSIFTTSWRTREGFGDKEANKLVEFMREAVQEAHKAKAIMVDANELNWVVSFPKNKEPEPHVIDVDSWAIDKWKASVIMQSIRDWHTNGFNQLSDWFSWGVVTFQVFTGIHPYKGILDGYKPSQIELRMKEKKSVFSPGVRLNKVVRDFGCIPGPLYDWYVAVFQDGDRTIPPSVFATGKAIAQAAKIARVTITTSGSLIFEKIFGKSNDPAIKVFGCGVVLLKSGILYDLGKKREIAKAKSSKCQIIRHEQGWLKADWDGNKMEFSYIDGSSLKEENLNLQFDGERYVRYQNRLFVVTDRGLTEISLKVFSKPIISAGQTWGVMVNSTHWYEGVGIQDALGARYVIAPFGDNSCVQIRVKELDGLKTVAAKSGNRFVAIMTVDKKGQYNKMELTFDKEYRTYQVWQKESQDSEINMSILPKGVTVSIVEDGELNIFVPANGELKKVKDKDITTEMILSNWNDTVVYIYDGNVWALKHR